MQIKAVLGIDAKNIITEVTEEQFTTSPGAINAVMMLVQTFGPGNVYLITKASTDVGARMREWLMQNDFFQKTGVQKNRVFFFNKLVQKEGVCLRLRVTHFVDEHLDVKRASPTLSLVERANNWEQVFDILVPEGFPH